MSATSEMLQALRAALAADAEFVAWCRTTFGSPPTIQIEIAELERLDDDDFPFICFFDVVQTAGIVDYRRSWELKVVCGVRNPAYDRREVNDCRFRTYAGRLEVEDLREQALAALFRAATGFRIKAEGSTIPNQFHPRYYSGAQLTIENLKQ